MRTCAWGLRGPHTIKCLLFLAPNWQKPSIKRSIQVPIHMFVWWGSSHSGILHSASMAAAKSCQISRFDCPVWTSEGIAFVATRRKYEKTIEGTWPGHFSLGSIWWSDSSTRAPSKSIQINEHEWTSKEHPWTSQKLSNLMILIWFTCPMPWNPLFDLGMERFVCNQTMFVSMERRNRVIDAAVLRDVATAVYPNVSVPVSGNDSEQILPLGPLWIAIPQKDSW